MIMINDKINISTITILYVPDFSVFSSVLVIPCFRCKWSDIC